MGERRCLFFTDLYLADITPVVFNGYHGCLLSCQQGLTCDNVAKIDVFAGYAVDGDDLLTGCYL